jgi:hypothetical protein
MEWYLSDHLGSTTLLVNESGLEVERTEYYPYGQVQSGGLENMFFAAMAATEPASQETSRFVHA